jgi:hypothetical protein
MALVLKKQRLRYLANAYLITDEDANLQKQYSRYTHFLFITNKDK